MPRFRWGIARWLVILTAALTPLLAHPVGGEERPPERGWHATSVRFEPLDRSVALRAGGIGAYRGDLEVRPAPGGLEVVNHVSLEDYLRGISEIPTSWPSEVQRAQAIAARTFAAHQAAAHPGDAPDLCASVACQVYRGVDAERRPGSASWLQAVAATSGQALTQGRSPILALYTSSNGGRSVPGGRSYLPAVDDPDDATSPLHHWRSELDPAQVGVLAGLGGPVTVARRIGDVVHLERDDPATGVVARDLAAEDFRRLCNLAIAAPPELPRAIPSVRFDLSLVPGGPLVVEGGGYGHGRGMSQYGALGKAQRGMAAADILASYYGGLRPTTDAELPLRISVALDMGGRALQVGLDPISSIAVQRAGGFRVLDDGGRVLAVIAAGGWTVEAEGDRVRVLPAAHDAQPPGVLDLRVSPPGPGSSLLKVRFVLTHAAELKVRLGRQLVLPPDVMAAGERTLMIPVRASDRRHRLTVEADAGGGRVGTASISVGPHPPARRGPGRPSSTGLATGVLALLAVGAALSVPLQSLRPGNLVSG